MSHVIVNNDIFTNQLSCFLGSNLSVECKVTVLIRLKTIFNPIPVIWENLVIIAFLNTTQQTMIIIKNINKLNWSITKLLA